jgi:murein L,D-transpeptidase YcbB/YkuD
MLILCLLLLLLSHAWLTDAADLAKPPPAHRHEERLRQTLKQYRQLLVQGGWPILPEGPTLRPGDTGISILLLRKRLQATDDLPASETTQDPTFFDDSLAGALRRFQRRHGLVEDGMVGPATRAALQVPIEDRIHQLVRNLDRWRELPRNLGSRYIWINIPAFTLHVVERDRVIMTMRVVVGRPSWPTPVLRSQLSALVFNPTWYIPPHIAQQEVMPHLQRDPAYLATHNMILIQGHGDQATEIAPDTVDWSQVPVQGTPYRFRQRPGPTNPLGRVKFIMPNPCQITLHDTPSRELFAKTMRAQSHGCIRLEKPIALAEYLLRENHKWTRAAILDTIRQGTSQRETIPVPIPVYLVYHTAWVDQDGRVQFRPDIYERDTPLRVAPYERLPIACG